MKKFSSSVKQPWTPSFETCARWRAFEGGHDRIGLGWQLGCAHQTPGRGTNPKPSSGNPTFTGGGGAVTLTLTLTLMDFWREADRLSFLLPCFAWRKAKQAFLAFSRPSRFLFFFPVCRSFLFGHLFLFFFRFFAAALHVLTCSRAPWRRRQD